MCATESAVRKSGGTSYDFQPFRPTYALELIDSEIRQIVSDPRVVFSEYFLVDGECLLIH